MNETLFGSIRLRCAFRLGLLAFLVAGWPLMGAEPIRVTATTTMVADLVRQVGGDKVKVEALMGPGVDPHLYKAAASDVAKLQRADAIFYSGLYLEGKMDDLFSKLSKTNKRVYAVTASIPREKLLMPSEAGGHPDPHVWFDVRLWEMCVDEVVRGLSETRPALKAEFIAQGKVVHEKLRELHEWSVKKSAEILESRRILVTSHDAYNYFGRTYRFQVVGLQGISTVTEAGLADMAKLVDFIKKNKVKAVFVESSVSPATIQRISRDSGARIGGELFSDAMGTPGQIENGYDLGTYEGMIKHNLTTIVDALK